MEPAWGRVVFQNVETRLSGRYGEDQLFNRKSQKEGNKVNREWT
jgi:hypothetical protein